MYIRKVRIRSQERALVMVDERPVRYLRPGVHRVVYLRGRVELVRFQVEGLTARLSEEQAAIVPTEDLRVLRLAEHERAVVRLRGRAVGWLGAGEHCVWTVARSAVAGADGRRRLEPAVTIEVLDTSGVQAAPLPSDLRAVVSEADYAEITVPQGAAGLRFVDGVLDAVLEPGRHAAWTTLRGVKLTSKDQRERVVSVAGQEVMTKDRLGLRLSLAATYRVADVRRLATVARDADEILYLAVQLAAREAVTSRTLDELLASRDALAGDIAEPVATRARSVGLELVGLALKDVVLPGDLKALLVQVTEAKAKAEASVILRREEAAAARLMAQTAKVLAESPELMRLKELEAYAELAGRVGRLDVSLGESALARLKLTSDS
jgi:regulator of protease activity HflC (stomatin/prohibitin superfamily)